MQPSSPPPPSWSKLPKEEKRGGGGGGEVAPMLPGRCLSSALPRGPPSFSLGFTVSLAVNLFPFPSLFQPHQKCILA